MSTIQIVGIAVAAVIVILLVIALTVTRRSGGAEEDAGETAGATSFLDSAPSDTFAELGRPERVPAPGSEAGRGAVLPEGVVMTTTGVAAGAPVARADGPDLRDAPAAAVHPDAETTGEIPAVAPAEGETMPAKREAAAGPPAEPKAAGAASAGPPAPASADTLVPLSSIIVTTSTKMIDLRDPEIRRMLTDLVTFEIDQATQFRLQGQAVDAVLQLTEAEKICRALGKDDTAREIRDMMRGLQA